MLRFINGKILFWLFVMALIFSVEAVRPIFTYGHQIPSTSSSLSSQPHSASNRNPGRHGPGSTASPSSAKSGQGSKHDPIDIESIPEKTSSQHQSPHSGHGSRTNPIHISDLGERTRPIELSDSQHGSSPVRQSGHGHSPTREAAARGSFEHQHSLYANKKRPFGKSTAAEM
ncbi:uncharacterized protein FA14DRAFT_153865 [Meira miltonrushii]|uniref:Uncharacterized protein n=1 Tax=Meira miltonrushii TaxID=1280837 RepID=A0A316VQU7_9BASI|nr:uncharacterized protein FA14DRAFT_153865 [Meira miltonrushii]PWN38541.1 hypothetical protein FA14DRAFT_153865 [Meira miltonrushii]